MKTIRFALIIINYRYPELTEACFESLAKSKRDLFKIFLINNYPQDGSSRRLVAKLQNLGLNYNCFDSLENTGFAGGMNSGIHRALQEGFEHIALLNNDTIVGDDFSEQVEIAARNYPDQIIAGTVLDQETGNPSYNIGRMSFWTFQPKHILSGNYNGPLDFVSGCFMVLPSRGLLKSGLLKEPYFMYMEDIELCVRLKRAGIRIQYCPSIVVSHKVSSTANRSGTRKEYYRIRNQTDMILNCANPMQKTLYLLFTILLLAYKMRHPSIFIDFFKGVRDALRGKLGEIPHRSGKEVP